MTAETQVLARFAVEHPRAAMPVATRDVVRQRFATLIGLATVGSGGHPADLVCQALAHFSNRADVGLFGRPERIGLCDAPVVTAAAIVAGLRALRRTGDEAWADGPIVAAAFAAAEHAGAVGADILDAVLIGTELGLRVERALSPALTAAGWLPGAVAGRLGAAAAAGRLLALDQGQMVSALGLACTQVAGFAVSATTSAGAIAGSKSAGDGMEAAVLARAGFSGPAAPIEGRRGLAEVLAPNRHDLPDMTSALGDTWLVNDLAGHRDFAQRLPCARTVSVALNMDEQEGVGRLLAISHDEGAQDSALG
jgi:2-methylcitrate dehydratase PrpD